MKKVLFICLLIVGLNSMPANASISNLNWEPEISLEYPTVENGCDLSLNLDVYSVQVLDINLGSCTANVYYGMRLVASFTRATCAEAGHAACGYITTHGGTCPFGY